MTEVAQISGYFFRGKIDWLILTKNVFGYILCEFFTNSSGHPPSRTQTKLSRIGLDQTKIKNDAIIVKIVTLLD
jgi:hypothetical protein